MHLGLVTGDLDDHAAHAERGGDDRVADGERGRAPDGLERRELGRGARRAFGGGAESPIPLALGAARRPATTELGASLALGGTRGADVGAQRLELATLAPRARARRPRAARSRAAWADARTTSISSCSSIARAAAPARPRVAASARRRSASASAAGGPALALARGGEQLLEPQALGRDGRARRFDDLGVEPEPRCHLQRVRGAGAPDRQRERRRERVGVEPDRGVLGAVVARRPLLELGVVGGHERLRAARLQRLEQRLRERGALDRIGAGRDLVEQHERARARDRDDRGDRAQVARERREAARDRLLVADVGEDLREHGQPRRARGRSQPALVQRGGEPERLQRDGLAAGVRARDDERAHARERQVDRDGRRAARAADGAPRRARRRRPARPGSRRCAARAVRTPARGRARRSRRRRRSRRPPTRRPAPTAR